jgi:hypothetical protein
MSLFQEVNSTTQSLLRWGEREFDNAVANITAQIYNEYGRLVLRRKYETLAMSPFPYAADIYDEAASILNEWKDLLKLTEDAYDALNESIQVLAEI